MSEKTINFCPPLDRPGPPEDATYALFPGSERRAYKDGDAVYCEDGVYFMADGRWVTAAQESSSPFVWVVVDGAITHQSPRAWVFDSEEEAVRFRCEKVEMHSRRHGSLSPVYRCELNPQDKNASLVEIEWNKYQLPKEQKEKKFQ